MQSFLHYQRKLYEHPLRTKRYLRSSFPREDLQSTWAFLFSEYPREFWQLVEDYDRDNLEKIEECVKELLYSSYYVGCVHGDPGSGKDSLIFVLLEMLEERAKDIQIYYYEEAKKRLPHFATDSVYSLNDSDISRGNPCIIVFRELAKAFPAREFTKKENLSLTQNTLDNRHFNQKWIGCAIKDTLVDLNYIRACNYRFYKYICKDNIEIGMREGLVTKLMKRMIPKDEKDKSKVLAVQNGRYSTFSYGLSENWTEEFSKSRGLMTDDEKELIAVEKLKQGMEVKELKAYMYSRYRFHRDMKYYNRLVYI